MTIPALQLYDTRHRAVRPFEPSEPGRVGMYTCGPTVYRPQHLGNMRSQLTPDLLRRVLLASGREVTYVTNITDVGHLTSDADEGEDKVEAAAFEAGTSVKEITGRWTDQWVTDRRRLGCLEPDIVPRAGEHIDDQIAMVATLVDRGLTYVIEDGVYFDVTAFPRYAEFAGIALDDLAATGRVRHLADKRHPADFALWKFSPGSGKRLQEWDSPWGVGFPGWHIECSAMATRYLGEQIDIHTGGVDHVRVHHSNEIAQSECALDVHPWVAFWVHSEFLDLAGLKMSKSRGHVLVVDSLTERGIDPLAFRYFTFQAHYRQQQTFTFDAVAAAGTALRRLVHHAVVARDAVGGDAVAPAAGGRAGELRDAFWAALTDDLNSSRALSIASAVTRDPELTAFERWGLLADFDRVLGFGLATASEPDAAGEVSGDPAVAARLAERQAARAARDFATADAIRDELSAAGIEITDTPDGPRARRRSA
ncbi:cysteine--tRNA ligase [Actinopolymorpha rutila]|uniref:Cysteine--tRNA ligase n=1 Tax=Actinopolymorpha rutila TaxID=446787 RepID=A0A852ZD77_9ACTN|nr:cysteinyl-tRNA synthetase [Actinopolymorpha rutila]